MAKQLSQQTIGDFLYHSIKEEGITDVFGVPGDYNFALLDKLEQYEGLTFINARNELNAGYAADAYARLKGMAALITTFGVGELSTANAIAGSNSENVPIIHIVGAPDSSLQKSRKFVHHTLMDGDFQVFRRMFEEISAYSAVLTQENAAFEIKTAIQIAKEKKKPVYLMIADDEVMDELMPREAEWTDTSTEEKPLQNALAHAETLLKTSRKTILLADSKAKSFQLESSMEHLAHRMNIPISCMVYGKGAIDEAHPNYIGIYAGSFGSQDVRQAVEEADCVIAVGLVWADTNTASFTSELNPQKTIEIQPDFVKIGEAEYRLVMADDMLKGLMDIGIKQVDSIPQYTFPYDKKVEIGEEGLLVAEAYYPLLQQFIKEEDIVLAETGTFFYGMSQAKLKRGVSYIAQGGWQSIGYALPATFGACIANPERRVLLFTGDGSLQLTVQEISSMLRHDCKPIIFILNNGDYTIEKYLNTETDYQAYNEIPNWSYTDLPAAFGGEAYCEVVETIGQLQGALKKAEEEVRNKLCLIELVVKEDMDAPDYMKRLRKQKKEE